MTIIIRALYWIVRLVEAFVRWVKKRYLLLHIGHFGTDSNLGRDWIIPNPQFIYIGNHVHIQDHCRLMSDSAKIVIKDHAILAGEVAVHAGDHRFDIPGRWIDSMTLADKRPSDAGGVVIEEDTWIGGRAIILQGVTIGRGAIVGGGAIITKDVAPYSIVVGVNKVVGSRFTKEEIKIHEETLFKDK